jgi:hypothetical protein
MCNAFAPRHSAIGVEVGFTALPASAHPWALQARVAMRPINGDAEAGHTGWFVLTPEVARRMAADLMRAAEAAERGEAMG